MPNNYVLLDRIELNTTAASVTFDNIPQTGYTDLKVVVSSRSTASGGGGGGAWDFGTIRFNGISTNYSERFLYGQGSGSAISGSASSVDFWTCYSGATASTFGNTEIYIPNYTSSSFKSISVDTVTETNATGAFAGINAGLWSNSAAITSIVLAPGSGSFVANSTFSLYGLAQVGTTPAIAPKADGGNVIGTDGTYWYHQFNSNGTFTPSIGLIADVLVVAGGGGGATVNAGGGGGGGFKTSTGFSITSSLAVTVGGGGAGGIGGSGLIVVDGTNGTNSVFSSITSTGGGGGGANANAGLSGGSGGGAAGAGAAAVGTASPAGQGNNGGLGGNSGGFGGGGGGGAGSVGGNAVAGTGGGNGGSGTSNSYSGSAVTYAGGGGGGTRPGYSGGTASGGGTAGQASANASNAANNLGGGGGGGGLVVSPGFISYNGGNGGSGVVIIRYPVA